VPPDPAFELPTATGNYWLYLLTNARRTVLYIGVTNGLLKRVAQHTLAERSSFTKRYHANTLIYYENYSDPRDAIARETKLKKWSRAKKEWLIAQMNPEWRDLGKLLRPAGTGFLDSASLPPPSPPSAAPLGMTAGGVPGDSTRGHSERSEGGKAGGTQSRLPKAGRGGNMATNPAPRSNASELPAARRAPRLPRPLSTNRQSA